MAAVLAAARPAGAAPVVLTEVVLPGAPFDGIAVTPDGAKLYVSVVKAQNPGLNAIAVIDTANNTVDTVIDLGDQGADNSSPRQLYISPDGSLLIHATYAGNLLVLDTATDTVIDTIPGLGHAFGVFTSDSAQLWSRDTTTKAITIFDTGDMSVLATLPLLSPGSSDFPLVITPDDAKIYGITSNEADNGFNQPTAVTAFDVAVKTQTANFGVGQGFLGNALTDGRLTADGQFLYTAGANSTTITKISVQTDAAELSTEWVQNGEALNLRLDGQILYAFENGYLSGKVRVYEPGTLTLIKTVDLTGQLGRFLATAHKTVFAPSGCAVIMPAPLANAIFAVDPATHDKIASFPTPGGTNYVVEFSPDSKRAYAPWRTGATAGKLTVFDLGPDCVVAAGTPCNNDAQCAGLTCVDGVCCDSPCGGDSPDDCQACSVNQGAVADGTCTLIAGPVCRPAAGECDVAEMCDGDQAECPADQFQPDDSECADGLCQAGMCTPDPGETTGTSTTGDTSTTDTSTGTIGTGTSTTDAVSSTGNDSTTSTTGAPHPTTGPSSDSGGDSDSGSGSVPTGTGGPVPSTSTGESSTTSEASDSGTGGAAMDDGCACDADRGPAPGWLAVLLAPLLLRRRRAPHA